MSVMVVTGASSGVGRAVALRFAQEGYTVCALARSVDKLERLAKEGDGNIFPYPTDVADSGQVERTFAEILEEHGRIDVLINNAGITTPGRDIVDFATVDQVIDTNLKGTIYCTFAALPTMRENGGGRIINIASVAGAYIHYKGNNGVYAASKHGVVAFSESIGRMVRKDGILVTVLCPGGIDTPLWDGREYPYDRSVMIRPEEVADLIAYILQQPERILFKNVIFVPVVEEW
ncbi:MAG: SDR family oxidoreductase [Anaerolineae bacterium]|nr:SDR family oxidoreductase [Anaerolineae bacterium]